jgi:hypothetical protein
MSPGVLPLGSIVAVLLSTAVHAQPASPRTTQITSIGFDLSRDLAAGRPASDERLQPLVERQEWRQSNVPEARWSYRPATKGPELEVAAFGAGHKDMPSLAHVGVDWSF